MKDKWGIDCATSKHHVKSVGEMLTKERYKKYMPSIETYEQLMYGANGQLKCII